MKIFSRKRNIPGHKMLNDQEKVAILSEKTGECIVITQLPHIGATRFTLKIDVFYKNHEKSVRTFNLDLNCNEEIESGVRDFPVEEVITWKFY